MTHTLHFYNTYIRHGIHIQLKCIITTKYYLILKKKEKHFNIIHKDIKCVLVHVTHVHFIHIYLWIGYNLQYNLDSYESKTIHLGTI